MKVKFKIIEDGKLPEYKTSGASCMDCYAREGKKVWLKPVLVPLGFAVQLPEGFEAQVRPRSGMSKNAHHVSTGTVDSDYIGEVSACIWSLFPYHVNKGDRVCQLYIGESQQHEVELVDTLEETERGSGGFGHTGR